MSMFFEQKVFERLETMYLDPDYDEDDVINSIGKCVYCEYDIDEEDQYRTFEDGHVHEDCLEEYLDEIWGEMSVSEKLEFFQERGIV